MEEVAVLVHVLIGDGRAELRQTDFENSAPVRVQVHLHDLQQRACSASELNQELAETTINPPWKPSALPSTMRVVD